MRNVPFPYVLFLCLVLVFSVESFSQAGKIIRACDSAAGKNVLNPNGDNYTSKTTTGFGTDDITNSEVAYKPIKASPKEPFGDLRRGPGHLFTDFVPDPFNNSFYIYFDTSAAGKKLLFRMRMGSVIPGSKGFSVLIDTDGKFGATGANADPNFRASTTGINGNPGFEIEMVLTTQTSGQPGLEIYDVDGTSSPVLKKSYLNYKAYSQVSVSSTSDNGDPDFFLDWYVPWNDLIAAFPSLTVNTSLRMGAATVMAPKPAIGGPISDIYSLGDNNYPVPDDEFTDIIKNQKPFVPNDLSGNSNFPVAPLCTAAPAITSANSGTKTVTGTWTKGLPAAGSNATVSIYKNGNYTTAIATIPNVLSGSAWTSDFNLNFAAGDTLTAKAVADGETDNCFTSNLMIATACIAKLAPPTNLCINNKGISGAGWTSGSFVTILYVTATTTSTVARGIPGDANYPDFTINNSVAGGWYYKGGCASNSNAALEPGEYGVNFSTLTGCRSNYVLACNTSTTGSQKVYTSPAVTINNANTLYPATPAISGTYGTGTGSIRVLVDSTFLGNATLTGGTWSFSFGSTTLKAGQVILLYGQQANTSGEFYCVYQVSATVKCSTSAPIITANANRKISAGSPVSGISGEPSGTIIKVYGSAALSTGYDLFATTTVSPSGTWITNAAAVNGYYYYATAANGTCNTSVPSDTVSAIAATSSARCGTITSNGISSAAAQVSGTLSGTPLAGTKVKLYLDDYAIDSITTGTNSWGPINVAGKLYAGATLKIGVQEPAGTEVICPGSAISINCGTLPVQPVVTPDFSYIYPYSRITYTVLNPQADVFYGIADSATGTSMGPGKWAIPPVENPFTLTTDLIYKPGILLIKASAVSGTEVCSSKSTSKVVYITSASLLPVTLVRFDGRKAGNDVVLDWSAANETVGSRFDIERSADGVRFEKIGEKAVAGSRTSNAYTFTDRHSLPVNYYRLKIIDVDGRYSCSNVIRIAENRITAVLQPVQPNPFAGEFTFSLTLPAPQNVKILLLDASGRPVKQKEVTGVFGPNRIRIDDLNKLSNGVYFIRVVTNSDVLQQMVLKQE